MNKEQQTNDTNDVELFDRCNDGYAALKHIFQTNDIEEIKKRYAINLDEGLTYGTLIYLPAEKSEYTAEKHGFNWTKCIDTPTNIIYETKPFTEFSFPENQEPLQVFFHSCAKSLAAGFSDGSYVTFVGYLQLLYPLVCELTKTFSFIFVIRLREGWSILTCNELPGRDVGASMMLSIAEKLPFPDDIKNVISMYFQNAGVQVITASRKDIQNLVNRRSA